MTKQQTRVVAVVAAVAGVQNMRVFVWLSVAYFVNLIKQKRFVCVFYGGRKRLFVRAELAIGISAFDCAQL